MGQSQSYTTNKHSISDLSPGDLITIRLKPSESQALELQEYDHYAVYVGDGRVVHNKCGRGWMGGSGGGVELISFEEFLALSSDGHRWELVAEPLDEQDDKRSGLSGELVAERAISRVGENKFHLRCYNSEHFARECRYGTPESTQVGKIMLTYAAAVFGEMIG